VAHDERVIGMEPHDLPEREDQLFLRALQDPTLRDKIIKILFERRNHE